ncbi:MAG: glycosyltransferase involved in cell wall biosynthesis [Alphaproteobacteria bacterium]|jgi:glycosyltransferase involved in cell wall biosynthesis
MTRLLQVMAGAKHGGAEAFFTRLAPALSDAGVDQKIIIRRNPERAAQLRASGVSPIELRLGGMFDCLSARGVSRVVDQFDPDIVLAWMNRATSFCAPDRHVLAARLGGYYNIENYRRCDHLIGNTRDIRDYLIREGWPAARAHYIPNFIDAAPQPPVDRAAFDTPTDAPLLLAMGRLHVNKGYDTLLDALAAVPGAYLWIAGEGPLRERLERQAATLGVAERVRFMGWREDGPALLAAADILVCPSRHEPLGNVVLEAWAHRKPVVAANSDGPGVLIDDGRTGLLTPIDDSDALARALSRAIAEPDLREDLSQAGYAAFQAEFTKDTVVAQYLAFFEAVTP